MEMLEHCVGKVGWGVSNLPVVRGLDADGDLDRSRRTKLQLVS